MPNIASLLKNEISRVARKEIRAETTSLKKSLTTYRSEIAALKRRSLALEQQLRQLRKVAGSGPSAEVDEPNQTAQRFSAKGLVSMRTRLGLSAADLGRIVGASAQSIYNWESGHARPREKTIQALSALKKMGKKAATALLSAGTT